MAFFLRWLFAFLLVVATYNPTPWNYVAWARANLEDELPLATLIGLLLFIGYVIYLRATLRSIGGFGMLLVASVFGALVWVLVDWQVLSLERPDATLWIGLVAMATVLGIGLSWSIVRRALTGQADVDDVDA